MAVLTPGCVQPFTDFVRIGGNYKDSFSSGLILLLISGMLFFVFVQAFGLEPEIIQYWPALLILLGLIVLIRALLPRKHRST